MGAVCTDSSNPAYIGASSLTYACAELSGITWALFFALQFCSQHPGAERLRKVNIMYDSTVAAHTADSLWYSSGRQAALSTAIYNTVDALTDLRLQHERGHSGLPFNECADSLCTYMADTQHTSYSLGEWSPTWSLTTKVCEAQWLYLLGTSEACRSQFPIVVSDRNFYFSTALCKISDWGVSPQTIASRIDDFCSGELEDGTEGAPQVFSTCAIRAVQVNASTLKRLTKRRVYLRQFSDEQVVFTGIQEARRPFTGITIESNYTIIQSACCPNGSSGNMLCVANSIYRLPSRFPSVLCRAPSASKIAASSLPNLEYSLYSSMHLDSVSLLVLFTA